MSLSPTARRLLEEFDEAAQEHGNCCRVDPRIAVAEYNSTRHQLEAFIEELEKNITDLEDRPPL